MLKKGKTVIQLFIRWSAPSSRSIWQSNSQHNVTTAFQNNSQRWRRPEETLIEFDLMLKWLKWWWRISRIFRFDSIAMKLLIWLESSYSFGYFLLLLGWAGFWVGFGDHCGWDWSWSLVWQVIEIFRIDSCTSLIWFMLILNS